MAKRIKHRFYHLRMSKTEGPYLDWSCTGFTDNPFRAWIGNGKAASAVQSEYPLAWIMVLVPSVKKGREA